MLGPSWLEPRRARGPPVASTTGAAADLRVRRAGFAAASTGAGSGAASTTGAEVAAPPRPRPPRDRERLGAGSARFADRCRGLLVPCGLGERRLDGGRGLAAAARLPRRGRRVDGRRSARCHVREGGVDAAPLGRVADHHERDGLAELQSRAGAARRRIVHQAQRDVHEHRVGTGVGAVRRVALDHGRAAGADRMLLDEVEERDEVVDGGSRRRRRRGDGLLDGRGVHRVHGVRSSSGGAGGRRDRDGQRLVGERRPRRRAAAAGATGDRAVVAGASPSSDCLASFTDCRLFGPRTGERSTNTQPTCGTGLPPMSRPCSNSQSYLPWNSWNESLERIPALALWAIDSTNASPRPTAPAGGVTSSLFATARSNSFTSFLSMRCPKVASTTTVMSAPGCSSRKARTASLS